MIPLGPILRLLL